MNQLNQFYQPQVEDAFYKLPKANQGLSQVELNRFIQSLLTTIDLPELSALYYAQLSSTLHLSGLKIQYQDSQLVEGQIQFSNYHKGLTCTDSNNQIATIDYYFEDAVSLRTWQILQEMHIHFSHSLKNALLHLQVKQFAMKDFLTSLGNRASYEDAIYRLICQTERNYQPFGLLMLDLDNFKQVNDSKGHAEGDKVLIECARTIQNCLRDSDFAFRFGGDEFCCLLPNADTHTNQLIATRIQSAIEASEYLVGNGISCSIGTAAYQKKDNQISLFSRADEALYHAKNTGKNCIKAA